MKNVKKSILIWYSPQEMYDLVIRAEHYPEFLPWCSSAKILEETPTSMVAKLGIGLGGLQQSFTTRNTMVPNESVTIDLVDGPFSHLHSQWRFDALPPTPPQVDPPRACRVHFQIDYEIASRALNFVMGPLFERITTTYVDAFVKRAGVVYGKNRPQ